MNHMLTEDSGGYKMPKHWRDSEDIPHNSKSPKVKVKNELKTPLFIFIKQLIEAMTQENASRVERYVVSYGKIENAKTEDKESIRKTFQDKVKSL